MSKVLNPLPGEATVREYMLADVAGALKLLEHHPGLARTDKEWHESFSNIPPLIFDAISRDSPELLEALLKAGSDINATQSAVRNSEDVLNTVRDKASTECKRMGSIPANTMRMLELLAEHPSRLTHRTSQTRMPPAAMMCLLIGGGGEIDDVIAKLLEKTPDDLLMPAGCDSELYPPSVFIRYAEHEKQPFAVRLLAQRGVDFNSFPAGPKLPFNVAINEKAILTMAQMLLCGLAEDTRCRDGNTAGMLLDSSQQREEVYDSLHRLLYDQYFALLEKDITPGQLFFADKGGLTWQAHAFARFNDRFPLLENPFNPQHAELFGGEQAQHDFALRLYDALPEAERAKVGFPALLRDRALARPDTTATVGYLRGTDFDPGRSA